MGLDHGLVGVPFPGDEIAYGGSTVQQHPREDAPPGFAQGTFYAVSLRPEGLGEVVLQQQEVVPVIETELDGGLVRKRTAADVIDGGFGDDGDPVPGELEPPAQVDLLHVGEEPVVQAAELFPEPAPDHQAGARHPEDIGRSVILAFVLLHLLHDTAPAERVAVAVQQAARRAGILKPGAVVPGQQLWAAGAAFRVGVHPGYQGLQPVFRHLDIGIDEDIILGFHLCEGAVVAPGEPIVLVQPDLPDGGKFLEEHLQGAVRRGAVGHDDFCVQPLRGGDEPGQEGLQVSLGVPVQYDDGGLHALQSMLSKAKVGINLDMHKRASSAVATRWFHRSMKLPVTSISRTGWVIRPSSKANPSIP